MNNESPINSESQMNNKSPTNNESATVLLIEDNKNLNEINSRALTMEGYEVKTVFTLAQARKVLQKISPEVILLDVSMPDGDGMDFCAEIRDTTDAHILFLTSRTEHEDKLKGLGMGGDDYITKPYKLDEMLARVKAAIRRRKIDTVVNTLTKGSLTLDTIANRAYLNGEDMNLTPKEFAVLLMFIQDSEEEFTAEKLYEKIWKQPLIGDDHSVKNTIYHLRKKLKAGNCEFSIEMTRGKGYRLESI